MFTITVIQELGSSVRARRADTASVSYRMSIDAHQLRDPFRCWPVWSRNSMKGLALTAHRAGNK